MAAEASEYTIRTQCLIPLALSLVHNFLRDHDIERLRNELHISLREEPAFPPHGDEEPAPNSGIPLANPPRTEDDRAAARRTQIAEAMWDSYQNILQARGIL